MNNILFKNITLKQEINSFIKSLFLYIDQLSSQSHILNKS